MRAEQPQPPVDRSAQREQIRQSIEDANAAVAEAGVAEAAAARAAQEAVSIGARRGDGNVSVTRDGNGRIVVNTADGRTIVVDPRAVASEQGQQRIIERALIGAPPMPPRRDEVPREVVPLVGIIFGCLTLMVLGLPLVRAWVRRFERRGAVAAAPAIPAEWGGRLERIEQAVESVAIEVERISEAQRFQTRLLAERAPAELVGRATEGARIGSTP